MSHPIPAVIATERLHLTEWDDAAWADFIGLTNTPLVMRWLGPVLDEAGIAAFRTRLDLYNAKFGHTFWCARRKQDGAELAGEVIGMVGLKRATLEGTRVFGTLEIGWRLREQAWGKGYAKEAASACLDHIFAIRDDDDVIALTVDGNRASWGLMERLGMQRRKDWDFSDPNYPAELNPTIVYHITRAQWEAGR